MNTWVKLYILSVIFLLGYLIKNLKKPLTSYGEKKEPNLKYHKVWGSLTKVNIPINKKRKNELKNIDCILLDILWIVLLIDFLLLIQNCLKFLMILLWNLEMPLF